MEFNSGFKGLMEGDCRGQIEGVMPAYSLDELRKHAINLIQNMKAQRGSRGSALLFL